MANTPDDKLHKLSRRQHGVFTLQQALDCGVSRTVLYRRVAAGRYLRRFPGVFADAAAPDTREGRWQAALLAVGGDAALAWQTAGDVHGMEHGITEDGLHLVVRQRTLVHRPGLVVHRSRHLDEAQIVRKSGLRVTSVERTLCDLAALVDPERLRKLVAAAVRTGTTTADDIRAVAERLGRFRGRPALLAVLDALSPLEPMTRSEMESLFVEIMTAAGIPPDAVNYRVVDAFGQVRYLDAVYLAERLPVELDSRTFHGTLLDWQDDLRRENAVKIVGWRDPLRFSWADLRHRPAEVVEVVRLALAAAREELGLAT